MDSVLCIPLATDCSWNECLGFVDLLVPYRAEKLSEGRDLLLPNMSIQKLLQVRFGSQKKS